MLEKLSSAGGNSQIIVTTHSPYFVSSKGFENVRMVRKRSGGKTKITATTFVEIEKRLTNALCENINSPTSLMARLVQILEPSQNELFFTSVGVLVEGQEDIAYISTHLDLSNQLGEFRALGCHFVVAEGKKNMSRLVAIAQELGIPVFAVVDGDSDAKPQDIENNRKDNKCLLKLFSLSGENPLPDKTLWNENFVMWAKRIGDTVKEEIGDAWEDAENKVREDKGFRDGVKRKNPMLITATLEELWNQGKQCASLIKLCGAILHYAQKVGM